MSNPQPSAIVSDAELQAALDEAQAQLGRIPTLEGDSTPEFVPVPVEADLRPLPRREHAEPSQPTATEERPSEAPPVQGPAEATPTDERPGILYRSIDAVLSAVNRPFGWMNPEVRRLTGLLAVVTLVTSLLALLLPTLFPQRDPLAELREKSAALRANVPGEHAPHP